MGSPESKFANEEQTPNKTPFQDGETSPHSPLDPRSPTADITRTPIQVTKKGGQQKITKHLNLNNSFSTPTKTEQPKSLMSTILRSRLLRTLDPRSPSSDIIRTPLEFDKPKKTMNNSNLSEDEVLNNSIDELSIKPRILSEEMSEHNTSDLDDFTFDEMAQIANEDLGSPRSINGISAPANTPVNTPVFKTERDRIEKQMSGFMETNLDYLETNLDEACELPMKIRSESDISPESTLVNSSLTPIKCTDVEELTKGPVLVKDGCELQNLPIIKPCVSDVCMTETPIKTELDNAILETPQLADPRSPSADIYRTPLQFTDNLRQVKSVETLNISTGSKKQTPKTTKLDEIRMNFAQKYNKNLKTDPKNQIYVEEECHKVTPRQVISGGVRTPLSCVRNKSAHPRSKSDNTSVKSVFQTRSEGKLFTEEQIRNFAIIKKTNTPSGDSNDLNQLENVKVISKCIGNKKISKIPTLQQKSAGIKPYDHVRNQTCDVWDQDQSVVI